MHERRVAAGRGERGRKVTIELHDVDVERLNYLKCALAGLKVIDCNAHAELAKRGESLSRRALIVRQSAETKLQHEQRGIEATVAECRSDIIEETVVQELSGRDVDRHVEAVSLVVPGRAIATRSLQSPTADRHDCAAVLQRRNERFGIEHSANGVAPAKERFDPREAIGLEIDRGLVHQKELAGAQSLD